MNIAYIVPSLRPLGPVIVVRNLVHELVRKGHRCTVFYFDEDREQMAFDCETRRISFWKKADLKEFDVLHVHCFRPMIYGLCCPERPKVVTLHSYILEEYRFSLGRRLGGLLGWLFMKIANRYDRVAVLSEDAKEYYGKWMDKGKLDVCYNGVLVEDTDKAPLPVSAADESLIRTFKGSGTLIAAVCELAKIKCVDLLIRALQLLPQEFRLVVIGEGRERNTLQELASRLQLTDRVLLLGERTEAHRYLPLVDVFAMTSQSEGFCLALAEAAFYGKQIVCSDIPGMKEKFSADELAFFPPQDVDALAAAIMEAASDKGKGIRAQRKAMDKFSAGCMAENYLTLYKHLGKQL